MVNTEELRRRIEAVNEELIEMYKQSLRKLNRSLKEEIDAFVRECRKDLLRARKELAMAERRRSRWLKVLLPLVVFLVGLFLGSLGERLLSRPHLYCGMQGYYWDQQSQSWREFQLPVCVAPASTLSRGQHQK